MSIILLVAIVIALAAGVAWLFFGTASGSDAASAWAEVAKRHGLLYARAPGAGATNVGMITGEIDGFRLRVESVTELNRNDSMKVTVFFLDTLPVEIELESNPILMMRIADQSLREVVMNYPDFEKKFHPRTSDLKKADRFLSIDTVQFILFDLAKRGTGVRMDEDKIEYFQPETETDPDKLDDVILSMVRLATVIETVRY